MVLRLPKLLVVDDSPTFLEFVRAVLSGRGYSVIVAGNGPDALDIAEAEQPDLVILDVSMEGMDGFDVLNRLRQRSSTSNMPVLMMTARRTEADVRMALGFGAQGYIVKPFETSDLLGRVHRLLNAGSKRSTEGTVR